MTDETSLSEKTKPARRSLNSFDEMERMMESAFSRNWMQPFRWEMPEWAARSMPFEGKMPKVDVIDRDGEIVVRAEVPGIEKKDLEISLGDNSMTIKGSTRREEKEEKGDYFRREISSGSFSRTVALPSNVDSGRSRANFKDGILEVTMPKIEKSKRRTIEVE